MAGKSRSILVVAKAVTARLATEESTPVLKSLCSQVMTGTAQGSTVAVAVAEGTVVSAERGAPVLEGTAIQAGSKVAGRIKLKLALVGVSSLAQCCLPVDHVIAVMTRSLLPSKVTAVVPAEASLDSPGSLIHSILIM